jgi:hypothetical protein
MARLFSVLSVFLAAIAANLGAGASAQDAYTTRIETRPFYGATVTIEEGVRVFRPLPPHRHIIINPGAKTPLNLSLNESNERQTAYDGGSGVAYVGNGAANGYASNSADYGDNGGSSFTDSASGLPMRNTGGTGSGPNSSTGYYGAKGRRLTGFAPHNVRVNGMQADQRNGAQADKYGGRKMAYNGYGRVISALQPRQPQPRQAMGYGTVRPNSVAERGMPRVNMANVKVYRPQMANRSYAPRAMPTQRNVVPQRYVSVAPRIMQAAPRMTPAAPAGRMGMGKGGLGGMGGRGR